MEADRLDFIRNNQKALRVECYKGVVDYLDSAAERRGLQPGTVHILPSSFIGSRRAMDQNYQDAMAIIGKCGKPDLFLTFTCNSKWSEITKNLIKSTSKVIY